MSLVKDATQLVPGDAGALRSVASTWRRLATLLLDRGDEVSAGTATVVSAALDELAGGLAALQAEAARLYDEVRGLGLPDAILFGDPDLLRRTLADDPGLRPELERLVGRGTELRVGFVNAQHDLVDRLQPIAHR